MRKGRRKLENKNRRRIIRLGTTSYAITIPVDYIRSLGWREKQNITVRKRGSKIIIEDWEK